MTPPREVPSWDLYFLDLAKQASTRSKDPSTQHGSLIVNNKKQVISTGYNGGCRKIPDRMMDWSRPVKYNFVIHSEMNAILFADRRDLEGSTIYITGRPCSRCSLLIAHVGISTVIFGGVESKMVDEEDWKISANIFNLAGVQVYQFKDNTRNRIL